MSLPGRPLGRLVHDELLGGGCGRELGFGLQVHRSGQFQLLRREALEASRAAVRWVCLFGFAIRVDRRFLRLCRVHIGSDDGRSSSVFRVSSSADVPPFEEGLAGWAVRAVVVTMKFCEFGLEVVAGGEDGLLFGGEVNVDVGVVSHQGSLVWTFSRRCDFLIVRCVPAFLEFSTKGL